MRRLNMLIVMTAMICVAAGSAKGITSPGQLRLDRAAVVASGPSSSPAVNGDESVIKTIFPAAPNSTIGQLFVAATAADGDKNPPSRSTHCPPDKDDHKSGDNQDKDNKDKDNKDKNDKDQHENCGKGDDGKNP
jgi:hypothetical protein